jgi:hypothetical protein
VNSVFLLRALAAWKMLRQRKTGCCRVAGKQDIHAECSKDQRSNSQAAGQSVNSLRLILYPLLTISGVLFRFKNISKLAACDWLFDERRMIRYNLLR